MKRNSDREVVSVVSVLSVVSKSEMTDATVPSINEAAAVELNKIEDNVVKACLDLLHALHL